MMTDRYPVQFFFGANTPDGFWGYHLTDLYDARNGWVAFLIKSGAGTGKATFMREVYDALTAMGLEGETVWCSSDPASLDAIVFPTIKLCVMDATAPHIVEPIAYGECEQLVPFGCCLRPEYTLAHTDEWFEAADACADSHARCCRFLAAAHSLLENSAKLLEDSVWYDKAAASAARLAKREFGAPCNTKGQETRRFLSAITPQGPVFFWQTAAALCPRLYVLEDEYGAVAGHYMAQLRECALNAGHDIISCACPLSPKAKTEHLLIPALGVAFLTSNSFHPIDVPVYRRVHATRFLDAEHLKSHKQQLLFNRRAAREMLQAAASASAEAKAHHDRMEERHVLAMDWDEWRRIADRSKSIILQLAEQRLS